MISRRTLGWPCESSTGFNAHPAGSGRAVIISLPGDSMLLMAEPVPTP
ncbi:MAG: hypothetical protein H0V43_08980 [Gemmatimonadales bacterium]|nr:hypothetical protein [Gemmatimonadales bacterium]